MIPNFWKHIHFFCTNRHDTPVAMIVANGNSPFYACPKYMRLDTAHPNGHTPDERACPNRISFVDAQRIVECFSEQITEDLANMEVVDYTGYEFTFKRHRVKVLKYKDDDIRLCILNQEALR